jgi:LacI family transcriptional regulator
MITTSEIARLCGVSRPTVSAVLNGKPGVSEKTRQKVLACIREHNYEPGLIAKSLVSELSRMVAVLLTQFENPFYTEVVEGIGAVLESHGYHILYHHVRTQDEKDPHTLAAIDAYRPAGYIIVRGAHGRSAENVRKVAESGSPLVILQQVEDVETHTVYVDMRRAAKQAANYVFEKGHRRVTYLAGPAQSAHGKERVLGFMESLVEHELAFDSAMTIQTGGTTPGGYRAALTVLANPETRPTALLCHNDVVAMGVYQAAYELGLHIPDDVSVVGFDGIDFGEVLAPPLTTVSIFPRALGKAAAEMLLQVIRGEHRRGCLTQEMEAALIERGSVRDLLPSPVL